MRADPLTYGVAALRWVLYGPQANLGSGVPGPALSLAVTAGVGALALAVDLLVTRGGRVE